MKTQLLVLLVATLAATACDNMPSFTSPSSGFSIVSSAPVAMVWPAPATVAGVRKASVGASCSGQPSGLTNGVVGSTVTLNWSAPAGCAPASYTIEAGSTAGASNVIVFDTGSQATSLVAPNVGDGTYFVRVRAGNSAPSNETVVTVGAPASPATPAADVAGMWAGSPVSLLVAAGRVAQFGVQSTDWPCHWLQDKVQDIKPEAQAVIAADGRFSMVVNSSTRVYSQSLNAFVVSGQFSSDGHEVTGSIRFSHPGLPPECGPESEIAFSIKR